MAPRIILEKQAEGGYSVYVEGLPYSCVASQGETKKEALKNIKEALSLYFDSLEVVEKPRKPFKSAFGCSKGIGPLTKEDRLDVHEDLVNLFPKKKTRKKRP